MKPASAESSVPAGNPDSFSLIISQLCHLDKPAPACYTEWQLNSIFRAGRNSPPAVKSASAQAQIRCNSETDSTVWMKEDTQLNCVYFHALGFFPGRILFHEVTEK